MSRFHLAQVNVARSLYPLDDPRMTGFMDALDQINALADAHPDSVWRMAGDSGNNTDVRDQREPNLLVNISVWRGIDGSRDYVYRGAHAEYMRRRREWFVPDSHPILALWWVPEGHRPTLAEGVDRWRMLCAQGPTPEAFSFRTNYPQPSDLAGS